VTGPRAVDRDEDAAAAEEELQLGDVPAAPAAPELTVAELVASPAAELAPSPGPGDPVHHQVVAALESFRGAPSERARDSVEGPFVVAALEEREL
jgi:hypothetical protein